MGFNPAKVAATFPAHHAPKAAIPRPGQSLLDRIGNTPLLRFDRLTADLPGVTLLGKAEWHNPGGSVKDRAAANIVADRPPQREIHSRQDSARRDQRKHRHCLCHAGRG